VRIFLGLVLVLGFLLGAVYRYFVDVVRNVVT
jgi:hypothetical protein